MRMTMVLEKLKIESVFFVMAFCLFLSAQEFGANRGAFTEMAKRYEVKVRTELPEWANRPEKPLFRLAWISDMHIEKEAGKEYHRRIFQQIKSEIHPTALLITGDSWGLGNDPVKRQQAFRDFLESSCGKDLPRIVLPGDNWPIGFSQVFGPSKFAFTLGGFRFVCASMDRGGKSNGCSLYDADTLEWLKAQFANAEDRPVIFVQHEPVEPPMTLDAPKVAAMMDKTPTAFLALAGHVHLNLEFTRSHWRQWIAPSSGRSHCPAFKVLSFYRFGVVSQDWEEGTDGKFHPVDKWLCAPVPKEYRKELVTVTEFHLEDYQAMPARAFQFDASLDSHTEEITQQLTQYAAKFAFGQFLKSAPKK